MASVVSAIPALDGPRNNRRAHSEMETTSDNEAHAAVSATPRKRKRSRKVHSDRKYDCTFEGCGKTYSRAEHLYRHQLNRRRIPSPPPEYG